MMAIQFIKSHQLDHEKSSMNYICHFLMISSNLKPNIRELFTFSAKHTESKKSNIPTISYVSKTEYTDDTEEGVFVVFV